MASSALHACVLRSAIRRLCPPGRIASLSTAVDNGDAESQNVTGTNGMTATQDPLPLFMQDEVQSLLRKITGFDLIKVAGPKKHPLKKPQYKLLTDAELQEMKTQAEKRLSIRLQMPPFMKERTPIKHILSVDPQLKGLDKSKYVFTDITFGVKDRKRLIVVRDLDGTLRKADWDERDRINNIYNPQPGRKMQMPKMFEEQNFEELLKEEKFVYILDLACVQFEPDSSDYIRITHRTFEVIDSIHKYDDLRCTRHFGPMAFYYAWYRKIDYLLIDMLNRELLSDAQDLVHLYTLVHPDSVVARELAGFLPKQDIVNVMKVFCNIEARHKGQLELAIQGIEEKFRSGRMAKTVSG